MKRAQAVAACLLVVGLLPACGAHRSVRTMPDPALGPFLERLAQNPDDVPARLELAKARRKSGDLEGALVEVYKALASDPRSASSHEERARIYFERGLVEKEIEAWKTVIELEPGRTSARENLGHALVAAGRMADAAAEYRRVLAASPETLTVLFNLAMIEMESGNSKEAQRLWTRYLEQDPSGPWSDRARSALETLAKQGGQ